MRNVKYAPNSAALGIVSNANRRAKRAAHRERRGQGIPPIVHAIIGVLSVIIVLVVL